MSPYEVGEGKRAILFGKDEAFTVPFLFVGLVYNLNTAGRRKKKEKEKRSPVDLSKSTSIKEEKGGKGTRAAPHFHGRRRRRRGGEGRGLYRRCSKGRKNHHVLLLEASRV